MCPPLLPQISRIENVSHLSELRVLNLASNNISRVDNLRGLDSLTELNLRRNCISAVVSVCVWVCEVCVVLGRLCHYICRGTCVCAVCVCVRGLCCTGTIVSLYLPW